MLAQKLIEVESEFNSLYNFTLRVNPSNRIQATIIPHYYSPKSKKKIGEDTYIKTNYIDSKAAELFRNGDSEAALTLLSDLSPTQPRKRRGGGWADLPWHLCQTASVRKFAILLGIYYMYGVWNPPALPPRKKFTATARLRILDAAGALEKSGYDYGNFYFFTGTLPGSSDMACQFFARNSRPFLNALKDFLRKRYEIYLTFNCWEWQLREKFHLTPALHLHLVIVTKDDELGAKLPEILKEKWFQLLDFYSDKYAVDLYAKHPKLWTDSEKAEGYGRWTREQLDRLASRIDNPCETCKTIRCEKSPAAYLSKYVGKGCLSDDTEFQDRFKKAGLPLYYPSSWWSISDEVRDLIDNFTIQVGFRNTIEECLRAYHLLEEIMEDKDWGLCQLILQPFIPKWASETRIYRNYYCKPEVYEMCQLITDIFKVSPFGETSKTFFNAPYHPAMNTSTDLLKAYFEADENHSKKNMLLHSLPFYHRINGGQDVDWSNPQVVWNAKRIIYETPEYPELLTLEERLADLEKIENESQKRFYAKWLEDYTVIFNRYENN